MSWANATNNNEISSIPNSWAKEEQEIEKQNEESGEEVDEGENNSISGYNGNGNTEVEESESDEEVEESGGEAEQGSAWEQTTGPPTVENIAQIQKNNDDEFQKR